MHTDLTIGNERSVARGGVEPIQALALKADTEVSAGVQRGRIGRRHVERGPTAEPSGTQIELQLGVDEPNASKLGMLLAGRGALDRRGAEVDPIEDREDKTMCVKVSDGRRTWSGPQGVGDAQARREGQRHALQAQWSRAGNERDVARADRNVNGRRRLAGCRWVGLAPHGTVRVARGIGDVAELMVDEPAARGRVRRVRAWRERDLRSGCERQCTQAPRKAGRRGLGVNSHATEVLAVAALHGCARAHIEGLAGPGGPLAELVHRRARRGDQWSLGATLGQAGLLGLVGPWLSHDRWRLGLLGSWRYGHSRRSEAGAPSRHRAPRSCRTVIRPARRSSRVAVHHCKHGSAADMVDPTCAHIQ